MQSQNLTLCQAALARIKAGVAGYKGEEQNRNYAESAFNIAEKYISAMDAAKIGEELTIDAILPYLTDLSSAL